MNSNSISEKIKRFKIFKRKIDAGNCVNAHKVGRVFKNVLVVGRLLDLNILKNKDGAYRWAGGNIDKKMIEKVYESIKEYRIKLKSNMNSLKKNTTEPNFALDCANDIKDVEKEDSPNEPYDNNDIANMIQEFSETMNGVRQEMINIKASMFDFMTSINELKSRILRSENVSLELTRQIKSANLG